MVAAVSTATGGDLSRSHRFATMYRALGGSDELRVSFTARNGKTGSPDSTRPRRSSAKRGEIWSPMSWIPQTMTPHRSKLSRGYSIKMILKGVWRPR